MADLVTRLRREQVALNAELEQARLQVASMQASPFWRAREVYARPRSVCRTTLTPQARVDGRRFAGRADMLSGPCRSS